MKRVGMPPTISRAADDRLTLEWPHGDRGDVVLVTPQSIEMLVRAVNDALDVARNAWGVDGVAEIASRCTRLGTEGLSR